MPAAIKAARAAHAPEALRAPARSGKDATRNSASSDGDFGPGGRRAGRTGGTDRQAVRDRRRRYNAEGPEGLRDRPLGGTTCFPDDAQWAVVRGWVKSGPDVERDGVVRWRVRDIRRKIEEAFGAVSADESIRRLLRREGFRFVSGCPAHPRGDAVAFGVRGGRDGADAAPSRRPPTSCSWNCRPIPRTRHPMETVFQYPRGNRLANRVFADAAAVAEPCRKAWDRFAAAPDRIASIMRREWAAVPAPVHTNHNGRLRTWIGMTGCRFRRPTRLSRERSIDCPPTMQGVKRFREAQTEMQV